MKKNHHLSILISFFRSIKCHFPFNEPWFTTKSKLDIEEFLLKNNFQDGNFLVCPGDQNNSMNFDLNVVFKNSLQRFKIVQKLLIESKCVFALEGGTTNFSTLQALIEFHTSNVVKPLSCRLIICEVDNLFEMNKS